MSGAAGRILSNAPRGLLALAVAAIVGTAMAAVVVVAMAAPRSPDAASQVCPSGDRTRVVSPRPTAATQLVPPGADALVLCRYNGLPNPPPLTVAGVPAFGLVGIGVVGDRRLIAKLTSELNATRPTGPYRSIACPADFGDRIVAYFGYPAGLGDVVSVGLSGCNFVSNGHVRRLSLGAPVIGQLEALVKPLAVPATLSGYVRLCGGPAPGRCRVSNFGVCDPHCATSDRVEVLNGRGQVVGTAPVHKGRFSVEVFRPGWYKLKLLGDGPRVSGRVLDEVGTTARLGHMTTVVFMVAVP